MNDQTKIHPTPKPQQFRAPAMGRALSMIARRPLEQAGTQLAVTASETAAPVEPCGKPCRTSSIVAL